MDHSFEPDSQLGLRAWLYLQKDFPIAVILYRKATGKQVVDEGTVRVEAMCFGLVDTQVRKVDDQRYALILRPRRAGGNWTPANVALARQLIKDGQMTEAGLAAFKKQ